MIWISGCPHTRIVYTTRIKLLFFSLQHSSTSNKKTWREFKICIFSLTATLQLIMLCGFVSVARSDHICVTRDLKQETHLFNKLHNLTLGLLSYSMRTHFWSIRVDQAENCPAPVNSSFLRAKQRVENVTVRLKDKFLAERGERTGKRNRNWSRQRIRLAARQAGWILSQAAREPRRGDKSFDRVRFVCHSCYPAHPQSPPANPV